MADSGELYIISGSGVADQMPPAKNKTAVVCFLKNKTGLYYPDSDAAEQKTRNKKGTYKAYKRKNKAQKTLKKALLNKTFIHAFKGHF